MTFVIDGSTRIIAHVGHPTATFKAPMIYNPYFASVGVNAAVVPMGVTAEDRDAGLSAIFRFTNVIGALVTMPHKVAILPMLDVRSVAVAVAGAANAVRIAPDGRLEGDMFDGEGFVRGVLRKGRTVSGASALVVGSGGVGSAIAAALARHGAGRIVLHDAVPASAHALADRLARAYPSLAPGVGGNDPAGFDIVVNATPLGMNEDDPLPFDPGRIVPGTLVGDVVMKREITPILSAARVRGAEVQVGVDMLFEQIPAYLDFFGLPTTTPEVLRALARISY